VPARARDIPQDLWRRLARLDGRFDFSFLRTSVPTPGVRMGSGLNFTRYWVVKVIEPARPDWTMTVEAADLASALKGAVEMAEGRAAAGARPPPRPAPRSGGPSGG